MSFTGFDEDGSACYDTKEAAIERAKQLNEWRGTEFEIMVQRKYAPIWFAHLVRGTWFDFLAYEEAE